MEVLDDPWYLSYIAEVVLWRVLTSFIGDYYFVEVWNLLYF